MTTIKNLLTQKWHSSELKKLLDIEIPLIQAPMAGGFTTPKLIAAAANAGALGSLGGALLTPEELRLAIEQTRELTNHPFAVNLFVPNDYQTSPSQQQQMVDKLNQVCKPLNVKLATANPPYAPSFSDQMQVIIDEKVPVFSFTFGIPPVDWLKKLKDQGTIIIGTATSLAEAKALETAGVDLIVAQSIEAGGHRGTFIGEVKDSLVGGFSLIPLLADHIKLPVIASGGIMDTRAIVAALTLGADGIQMGTAFLSCKESGIQQPHKNKLLNSKADETTLTKTFSGKYARAIRNQFITELTQLTTEFLDYPVQNAFTKELRKIAATQNNPEFMSLYAGQSAFLSTGLSTEDLLGKIKHEMNEYLG